MLKSHATDASGNVQHGKHEKRFGAYAIYHTFPIEAVVRQS